MLKRTKTYTVTSLIWLTFLVGVLAYVFVITGCADGRVGERGAPGVAGPQGPQGISIVGPVGPAGLDGRDGVDANPITVVPLCPGVSNYGVFVEVGLCINGDLYGVYSANGGFLTYLAPGNYRSNAIGSACNLTVNVNCVVSH